MQILSIEFIFGANESVEDLEDEDDRYSDRRVVIKYRDRYDFPCESTLVPAYGGYITHGNGNELTPESCLSLVPWLHGGELNAIHTED
jgi:hypothetical protein